jgi:hypothetical protein
LRERFGFLTARGRAVALLGAFALAAVAAACGEKLEDNVACATLCPAQDVDIVDTVLDAVSVDTSVSGFPTPGTEFFMLLTARGDTVDTRGVIRFDTLPTTFTKSTGGDTTITAVDSAFVQVLVDTTGTRATQPVTIEAYDVDTTAADTVRSTLLGLFRPDRLLGSKTFTVAELRDSIQVPIANAAVLGKITGGKHLRVGLRATSTASATVRLFTTETNGAAKLSFRPTADTAVQATAVSPNSLTPTDDPELAADLRDYMVVAAAPPGASGSTLSVGGLPSRRIFLRFDIPRRIVDSSTVLRATLLLTQRPNSFGGSSDSLVVFPVVVTASSAVTDIARAANVLTLPGIGIDSVTFFPNETGTREIDIVFALRQWHAQAAATTRTQEAIVLRAKLEGSTPFEASFYSTEAPLELRPRLRLSYVSRLDFGRP